MTRRFVLFLLSSGLALSGYPAEPTRSATDPDPALIDAIVRKLETDGTLDRIVERALIRIINQQEEVNRAAEAQRQRENYAKAQSTLSDEILALFPDGMARRGNGYSKEDKNISFYLKDHNGYGDIEVFNDSCSLKLRSIPCQIAKQIIQLIAKEGQ